MLVVHQALEGEFLMINGTELLARVFVGIQP